MLVPRRRSTRTSARGYRHGMICLHWQILGTCREGSSCLPIVPNMTYKDMVLAAVYSRAAYAYTGRRGLFDSVTQGAFLAQLACCISAYLSHAHARVSFCVQPKLSRQLESSRIPFLVQRSLDRSHGFLAPPCGLRLCRACRRRIQRTWPKLFQLWP